MSNHLNSYLPKFIVGSFPITKNTVYIRQKIRKLGIPFGKILFFFSKYFLRRVNINTVPVLMFTLKV